MSGDSPPPKRPNPSLQRVALAAGVAPSTASAALSGSTRISSKTRERVLEAANRLGYRPNPMGRSLRSGGVKLVGIVFDPTTATQTPHNPQVFLYQVFAGLLRQLSTMSMAVIAVSSDELESISGLPVDTFFVMSTSVQRPIPDELPFGTGLVVVGNEPDDPRVRGVINHDHNKITRVALDHLYSAGSRRPCLILRPDPQNYTETSRAGYVTWCAEHGIEPVVIAPPNDPAEVVAEIAKALEEHDVDGIYTLRGEGATALAAAQHVHRAVPEQLKIVALSEGTIEQLLDPPVTSLSLEPIATALAIAEVIRTVSEGGTASNIDLPYRLVPRRSTA